ncbi:Bax inhibitor-1/YccA family protein [Zhouia sp. PK063]|uniref:Bax inhibitor-1/YccA family protein n=1 Tax=Zhouia sp. PK063 TaxID=3373602 RepID=UPI003796BC7A
MNNDFPKFTNEGPILVQEHSTFLTKVYSWMFGALLLTGIVALWVANSTVAIEFVFSSKLVFYGLLIAEILCVGYLSARINKMSATTAILFFLGYAILNGLTISVIFLVFTAGSIASTFFITAGTFGAMSLYGYFTKTDLTSFGNLAIMAVVGLIIASVVNMFLNSETLYWIVTYLGVFIFVGLTAYDTQKLKRINLANASEDTVQKASIMGALNLYLDFVNLFLFLLRMFGRRK